MVVVAWPLFPVEEKPKFSEKKYAKFIQFHDTSGQSAAGRIAPMGQFQLPTVRKVALAIVVPLRKETHRPSCAVSQRATGAIMESLGGKKVALAIAVPLRIETHRPSCSVAHRATGAIMDHLLED